MSHISPEYLPVHTSLYFYSAVVVVLWLCYMILSVLNELFYSIFLESIFNDVYFLGGAPTSICHFFCLSIGLSCTISQEPYII